MTKAKMSRKSGLLILLCSVVYFCSYLTRLNYGAVLVEIVSSEGITKTAASLAQTGLFVCYGLGQIVSGYLGDLLKPERMIFAGLTISAGMNIAVIFSPDPLLTAAFWCVNGFAQAMIWPPMVRIFSLRLSDTEYDRACISASFGGSVATIGIYLIAPLCVKFSRWQTLFIITASVAAVVAVVWLVTYSVMFRTSAVAKTTVDAPPSTGKLTRFPTAMWALLLPIILIVACQGLLRDGIETWMPSYIADTFPIGNALAILSNVVIPIFAVICRELATRLYRTVKNDLQCSLLFFVSAGVSFTALLVFRSVSPVLSVALFALAGGCMHGVNTILTCFVPRRFMRFGRTSLVAGLINSGTYVGSALSSYGVAVIATRLGWNASITTWIAVAALACVLCGIFSKKWRAFIHS